MNAFVFDASPSHRRTDDNGYLHVEACNVTKEQIAPYYGHEIPGNEELGLDPNKEYQMYRPAEELQKAVDTFNGVPLAFEHHTMSAESMPKEFIIGSLGTEAQFKAPYITNALIVTDQTAIDAITSGECKELSAAYRYTPVMETGTFNGKHYDGRMTNISANHVALVREGRAGHDVVVADSALLSHKKEERKMCNMSKVSNIVKRAMAFDAVPDIEHAEVNAASLLMAINVVEAQREGLSPQSIGLEIEDDATVDQIVEKFFPNTDESVLVPVKELLGKLKGSEEESHDTDPMPDNTEGEKGEEELPVLDADTEAEMTKCGLDAENPESVKAFTAGMKYGEGKEKPIEEQKEDVPSPASDADHEDKPTDTPVPQIDPDNEKKDAPLVNDTDKEDEQKAEEEKMKTAMDAQINRVREETKAHFRDLQNAARECASLAGSFDIFAFDSASDIYKKTLELNGISTTGYEPSAFKGMVNVLKMSKGITSSDVVTDSRSLFASVKEDKAISKMLSGIERINIL